MSEMAKALARFNIIDDDVQAGDQGSFPSQKHLEEKSLVCSRFKTTNTLLMYCLNSVRKKKKKKINNNNNKPKVLF